MALAATWVTACFQTELVTPSLSTKQLVVQSVLDAAARDQYVIVQATEGAISTQVPVAGANVTMTLPNGASVTAVEVVDSSIASSVFHEPTIARVYRFAADQLGVPLVPGGRYELRVVVPDGRVVTGHTTIPAATVASLGADTISFDRASDTLRTNVARVAGAASYEVDIAAAVSRSLALRTFTDTAVSLPGTMEAFTRVATPGTIAPATVVISALDSAYYAYYRRGGDPLSGIGVEGNLTGALGVFGSIVEIKRFTLLVR